MPPLTPPPRRAIALGLALALPLAGIGLARRSPGLRASFSAAYRAFRDPALLDAKPAERPGDATPPLVDLEPPDLGAELERASPGDLVDAGVDALAQLTLPDLPFPVSKRTARYVGYFASTERGRQAFLERFRRGGRYRAHVERALRDAEFPEDLVWLVAVESGFNPQAVSPKGAAGLFQFMPETAARYGLAQTEAIDERRSITRSTSAGVAYLRDLFARYGAWDLALAGYNFGEDRLDDAVARLRAQRGPKRAGEPVTLEDLAEARLVPRETASFVPQVQAFAIVAANRGRFGLDEPDAAEPFSIGELAVPAGTPLRLVARAAGVSIEVMRDYNPDLLRAEVPASGGDALVNVPADRVARALAAFPALLARSAPSAPSSAPSAPSSAPSAPSSAAAPPASAAPAREVDPGRRQGAQAARRAQLEHRPYGTSWIALSEHLFPEGHPLAGTLATAPLLPLLSVVFAEPPPDEARDPGPASPPHPGEERVELALAVPAPRVLLGWIGPPAGDPAIPVLRLAMLLLAHDRFGRVARALVTERFVAVHVRGSLELFARASVATIEAVPSVKYDAKAVERELDAALDGFAAQGPTAPELLEAKAQLRARLDAERARASPSDEPKAALLARLAQTGARAEAATAEEVQALVKQVFAREHRVVVTTTPRG